MSHRCVQPALHLSIGQNERNALDSNPERGIISGSDTVVGNLLLVHNFGVGVGGGFVGGGGVGEIAAVVVVADGGGGSAITDGDGDVAIVDGLWW